MSDRVRLRVAGWLRAHGAVMAMIGAMAVAVALPEGLLPVGAPDVDRARVIELRLALNQLPAEGEVVVGFDPDLGTYPELRYATRVLFADLLERGARISFVSFTPEGRLLALAELDRLASAGAEDRVADLGFVPGAEAALVRSVAQLPLPDERPAGRGEGLGRFDLAVVVGGIDLHPRSWVEQVRTRLPQLPVVGMAPSFLQPELRPYLDSGQLAALLANARDMAAYAAAAPTPTAPGAAGVRPVDQLALSIGLLVAIGALLESTAGRTAAALRRSYRGLRNR